MGKSHGMSSKQASEKKRKGHEIEEEFAKKIKGFVCRSQKYKKDVVDEKGHTYSIKGGNKLQIFLYRKSRFKQNTEFKGFSLAPYFLLCFYEGALSEAMELLKDKLKEDESIRRAFLSKAFFNTNEVDILVLEHEGKFNKFKREDVVNKLSQLEVSNSKGSKKVIFKRNGKTVGEIEYRTDKESLKFWVKKKELLEALDT